MRWLKNLHDLNVNVSKSRNDASQRWMGIKNKSTEDKRAIKSHLYQIEQRGEMQWPAVGILTS